MIHSMHDPWRPIVWAIALLFLQACSDGGGASSGASQTDVASGPAAAATAGNGAGPDTSGLGDIILGKINADPGRQDMKVTGKLLDFRIVSSKTDTVGDVASAVVECAGTVVFDGDSDWGMAGMKKAGEPAKFECQAEYVNQGGGWEPFGPMGIYPL